MTRTLRVLGLTALVALALGAVQASAAQADVRFRAESYPATVAGKHASVQSLWYISALTIGCPQGTFVDVVTSATSALDIAPSYGGCTSNKGYTDKISANGCTYSWSVDEQTGESTAVGGQAINCPAGKQIEIARYDSGGVRRCLYAIPAQGPSSGGIDYQNQGSGSTGSVLADIDLTGIQGTVVEGGALLCGKSSGASISVGYSAEVSLPASNGLGEPVGFSVGNTGLYMAGEESFEPISQPRIESEVDSEPVVVAGSQDAADPLTFSNNIRTFICNSFQLTGELTGSTTGLPLEAEQESCIGNGNTSVVVDTNSCHYVLNVLNVGPPYGGSLDLACATEGDGIEVRVWATGVTPEPGKELCIIKIPAQEGLGSIALQTVGAGFDRRVAADFSVTGMSYQRILGKAVNCGSLSGTNGTLGGTVFLEAL